MNNLISIETKSGYEVPLFVFKTNETSNSKTLIILPALGVTAKFYIPLAKELTKLGINTLIMEQRGKGESSIRANRHNDFGFYEWIYEDIPAVINWSKKTFDCEISLLGHSLGGHIAVCFTAAYPNSVSKIILPATGSPWIAAYSGIMRFKIRILYFLLPLICKVLGYYNGNLLGFGGIEARTLMSDWRHLISNNQYKVRGSELDINESIKSFAGQVLSISFQSDELAPMHAVEAVLLKFKKASIERKMASTKELGLKANHFNWIKEPKYCSLLISEWIHNEH